MRAATSPILTTASTIALLGCASLAAAQPLGPKAPPITPSPAAAACSAFERLPAKHPGFWPVRDRELWFDAALVSDWDPATGRNRAALGLGFEYTFPFDADARFRLGPRFGVQVGRWGDDRHAAFSVDPGLRFRASFYQDPILDVYALGKLDVPVAIGAEIQAGLRPGLGVGLRLARAVQLEASFDVPLAIGAELQGPRGPTAWVPGMWLGASFDVCALGSFCDKPTRKTEIQDDTSKLYDEAHGVCVALQDPKWPAGSHAALCAALAAALDGDRYPPGPRQDSTDAFLQGVRKELEAAGQPALVPLVTQLLVDHEEMEACRRRNAEQSRLAAQDERTLATHYSYSPFPVLLRRALGCSEAAAPGKPHACPKVVMGEGPAKP